MGPGALDRRVQFRRRAASGAELGAFAAFGGPVWAGFRSKQPVQARLADLTFDLAAGELTIRNSTWARTLLEGDRALVADLEYEIRAALQPDRRATCLSLGLRAVPTAAYVARVFAEGGETVTLRRNVPGGPALEGPVRARVTGYTPVPLDGGIHMGESTILLLASDVAALDWPGGVRGNDLVVVRGRPLNVEAVDDNTHRLAGDLVAHEVTGRG
jgi:hypothetical protein